VRWSESASEAESEASYAQQQTAERAYQAWRRATILRYQAEGDVETVNQAKALVESLTQRAEEGIVAAGATLAAAASARNRATATHDEWLGALDAALAWLARAEERLARAQAAYDAALSEYNRPRVT